MNTWQFYNVSRTKWSYIFLRHFKFATENLAIKLLFMKSVFGLQSFYVAETSLEYHFFNTLLQLHNLSIRWLGYAHMLNKSENRNGTKTNFCYILLVINCLVLFSCMRGVYMFFQWLSKSGSLSKCSSV